MLCLGDTEKGLIFILFKLIALYGFDIEGFGRIEWDFEVVDLGVMLIGSSLDAGLGYISIDFNIF